MAQIIPSDINKLAFRIPRRELETLELLQRSLPVQYAVFHGVHWSREYARYPTFGEIDFVVVNQSGDVLVIEQKNGGLLETDAGLVKEYEDGRKNVGEQVQRSLDAVRDKFRRHNAGGKLNLDYLVYCPDYRVRSISAPGLDASRVVDAADSSGLAGRIEALLGPGNPTRTAEREAAMGFFAQAFEVVPDVHAHAEAQQRAFARLSGGLRKVVDNLHMQPFRLRVQGVAGCGKSQLARTFFDRAVAAGKRPLLVCFNRPLSERLKRTVGPGGAVYTFDGLCDSFVKAIGKKPDYAQMGKDPEFWRKVQDRVIESEIPADWRFDALIVDEGQDLDERAAEILELFLEPGADVLWLEDADQNVRALPGAGEREFVTYTARENHRTPYSIARFIQDVLPMEFECANEVPGLGVEVTAYDDPEEQVGLVGKRVTALLKKGFKPEDIVVLTCRGIGHSALSEVTTLGGLPVRRFTGEYDAEGNQLFSEGKVYVETVYRYKGQQSQAVIVTDIDPPAESERHQKVLYTAMTRATVRLELLVRDGNPANAKLLKRV